MELETLDLEGLDGSPIGRRTYDALAEAIVTSRLEPGTVLSDRRLAEALGVSRTPVRDALHMLVSSGLVERRPGRVGWAVTCLGHSDISEVYELRRLLEPAGLQSIPEWNPAKLAQFDRVAEEHDAPPNRKSLARYLAMDREFHRLIVECSGNSTLIRFYEGLELQIDRIRHYVPKKNWQRIEESFSEHRTVLEAIARQDSVAAKTALAQHISAAEAAVLALL